MAEHNTAGILAAPIEKKLKPTAKIPENIKAVIRGITTRFSGTEYRGIS